MHTCASCGFADAGALVCGMCGASRPLALGPLPGGLVLDAAIGEGQCGTVFRARQVGLDRPIALKVPLEAALADGAALRRFEREAAALAAIDHPNVVGIHHVGTLRDGRPYLAMELLEGDTLDDLLADGPMEVDRAMRLAAQLAGALAAVHAAGLVHRDVKPSNVLVTRDHDGAERAVLIDFGIVRTAGDVEAHDAALTNASELIGTPHYMAPEHVQGERAAGAVDQYGLGVTLFRMLTGDVPFRGSTMEVVVAHVQAAPPAPSSRRPELSVAVDALVLRCLAKRPGDRFASCADLRDALLAVRPTRSRRRPLAALAALSVAAAAALALALATQAPSAAASQPPVPANEQLIALAPPVAPTPGTRFVLLADDGLALRLTIPAELRAGHDASLRLELWDDAGEPVHVAEVIVTLEGPDGVAHGFAVRADGLGGFRGALPLPRDGRYTVRVFPPIGDVGFAAPLVVGDVAPSV